MFPDTFESAYASAQVALTAAARLIAEESTQKPEAPHPPAVFALTRPPGHHAATSVCGGYCFLNNCAIAARWLSAQVKPGEKIGILDM